MSVLMSKALETANDAKVTAATTGARLCLKAAQEAKDYADYNANAMAFDAWLVELGRLDQQFFVDAFGILWDQMVEEPEEDAILDEHQMMTDQVNHMIDLADKLIDDGWNAVNDGAYEDISVEFNNLMRLFDEHGIGDKVDQLVKDWNTMALGRGTFKLEQDEVAAGIRSPISSEAWQDVMSLVRNEFIVPMGDGYFAVRFPDHCRIELMGTAKGGRTVTQLVKSLVPQVWQERWQARIVAVA